MKLIHITTLVLGLAIACAGPIKPPTPHPPRPVGLVAPGASGTAYLDDQPTGHSCTLEKGYCEVVASPHLPTTYVMFTAPGFKPWRQDGVVLPDGPVQVWAGAGCVPNGYACVTLPALVPIVVDLPRLVVRGRVFGRDDGTAFTVKGADGYTLYQQFLDKGEAAIAPQLDQLHQAGVNTVRVFGMYDNSAGLGHFRPEAYGEAYWTQRQPFYQALATRELYGLWTQFADATQWTCQAQQALADGTTHAFAGITNVLVDWTNEEDQRINALCPAVASSLGRVPGVLTSRGSNGSQAWPPGPALDWLSFHTNDAPEEERKMSHNCYEIDPTRPCVTTETSRAPGARNWNVRPDWFAHDAWQACTLLNAGCVFHSDEGKAGALLGPQSLALLKATVAGANDLSLTCQNLPYVHRQDLEPAGVRRTYQGDSRADCITVIRISTP